MKRLLLLGILLIVFGVPAVFACEDCYIKGMKDPAGKVVYAFVERATAHGASIIFPVVDQEYGWRQGRIEDPFGHQWVVGKPIA